jgi:hypothetical protein
MNEATVPGPLPKPLRWLLGLWVLIWAFFLVWPVFRNSLQLGSILKVLLADEEGRRAASYGPDFYAFLRFCKEKLPAGAAFRLVGIDYAAVEKVRAFYFLYPCLVSENPDYILVYRQPDSQVEGAYLYAAMDPSRYILKTLRPSTQ